mgnify:FL=1
MTFKLTINQVNQKANTALQEGKYEEAERLYRSILLTQPKNLNANTNLGVLLFSVGKLEEAEIIFKKAIKLKPDYAEVHNNLALTLQKLDRLDKAEISHRKAIEFDRNNPLYYFRLGTTLERLCNFNEAEMNYRKVLEIEPKYTYAHLGLANTLMELKKFTESEENYRKFLEVEPNHIGAYNNLASLLKQLGKYSEAEIIYNKVLSINPKYEPSLINRGQILFDKGQFELALKDFDTGSDSASRTCALSALYALGRIREIYERIEKNSKLDDVNLSIAAFSAFISTKEGKKTANNFCRNPIDFIYFSNLKLHLKNSNLFINEIINELDTVDTVWEPAGKSTYKGFQSNNLFRNSLEKINDLKSIIIKELDLYFLKFKDKSCTYIKKWPSEKNLASWHVVQKKQGYQKAHIHPAGWLSGVIYLKVVPSLGKNEGAIEFSLNGEKYNDINSPKKIYEPEVGDIVFFPSTLHHRTIPFTTNTDRIIISFDLKPNIIKKNEIISK